MWGTLLVNLISHCLIMYLTPWLFWINIIMGTASTSSKLSTSFRSPMARVSISFWDVLTTFCLTLYETSEAGSWEEKLNRIHVLFDVWTDVQRQWVYLEGIFSGSADIKHLLPVESACFQNINAKFLTIMKKVYKLPFVIDVMNIQGTQKSLERLADLFNKIQKALGEYLECEWSLFPQFYFIGDEYLLEIIGNSKDILCIMKHLRRCLPLFYGSGPLDVDQLMAWLEKYPTQLVTLAVQVAWTTSVESTLESGKLPNVPLVTIPQALNLLADIVLQELSPVTHWKCEHLIMKLVHQQDVIHALIQQCITDAKTFTWLSQMRFYPLDYATFPYGWEYLGIPDCLVQTPLMDRVYLTLTQALDSQLGGSPFGPAGTAMGHIFVGLCQVRAWGCFNEFNQLEERILSAVSQQVQSIQQDLEDKINKNIGTFHTPCLLESRMAMTQPDHELIAQVMLFSQGFHTAVSLASKIIPFFNLCNEQLLPQPHYDFGLCALKAVLASADILKHERLQDAKSEGGDGTSGLSDMISEQIILIQSVTEMIVPKLVADDTPLLMSLLADVFPGPDYVPVDLEVLCKQILKVCAEHHLVDDERWVAKILQLYQIQKIQHGLMMVGPSRMGKTNAWQVLLAVLERLDGIKGVPYVIDPKAIHKDALYGTLDPTTCKWNDGLFMHILQKIVDDVCGESLKRHWIIFNGDINPEWVENLNSILDDNKLLMLPNGERLNIPLNVHIMFEVEHLHYTTLATVSCCGMIWFSEDVIEPLMVYCHYLSTLSSIPLNMDNEDAADMPRRCVDFLSTETLGSAHLAKILEHYFADGELVSSTLKFAESINHIMDFTTTCALHTLFSFLNKTMCNIIEYNIQHSDFPLPPKKVEQYVTKHLLVSIIWAFSGDAKLDLHAEMGDFLCKQTGIDLLPMAAEASLIDFDVQIVTGEWIAWQSKVPSIEIDAHAVTASDIVIPTMDIVCHEEVLHSWVSKHKPLMLCGPPGSGKMMTLFSVLRKLPNMEVVGLNFSSATTPKLILKMFEQYCKYRKTPNSIILVPAQIGHCAGQILHSLVECGGYWCASDMVWVKLEHIQFVGACNPPTNPDHVPLSHHFLRHAPLVKVNYPGEVSLKQIYGTYNRTLLKVIPTLRVYAELLTHAMVSFYFASQKHFTSDVQAHYVYSPCELTRWVHGIYEAIYPLEILTVSSPRKKNNGWTNTGPVTLWLTPGCSLDLCVDGKYRLGKKINYYWYHASCGDDALNYPTLTNTNAWNWGRNFPHASEMKVDYLAGSCHSSQKAKQQNTSNFVEEKTAALTHPWKCFWTTLFIQPEEAETVGTCKDCNAEEDDNQISEDELGAGQRKCTRTSEPATNPMLIGFYPVQCKKVLSIAKESWFQRPWRSSVTPIIMLKKVTGQNTKAPWGSWYTFKPIFSLIMMPIGLE
ncbi:hypothetical protein BS17DRAFT_769367 [Gyrodon lividus]|nr:hypothetical protein BS17DRAFT_769367 [Gyrodon lividus]